MNALSRIRSARIRASVGLGVRRALGATEDRDRGVERARRRPGCRSRRRVRNSHAASATRVMPHDGLEIAAIERVELAGLEIGAGLALHRASRTLGAHRRRLAARRSDPSSRSARRRARRWGRARRRPSRTGGRRRGGPGRRARAPSRGGRRSGASRVAAVGDQLLRDLLALDELADPIERRSRATPGGSGSLRAERRRRAARLDGDRVVVRATRGTREQCDQSSAVRNRRDA